MESKTEKNKHRKRYRILIYARLTAALAMLSLMNYVFSKLFDQLYGQFNFGVILEITLIVILFIFVFAVLLWGFDTRGTLGRLLGARDEV
jgi:polyferredoxin